MNNELPEVLELMLNEASQAQISGDTKKAEEAYILTIRFSRQMYYECSSTSGLVLIRAAKFFNSIGKVEDAAILLEQAKTITTAYQTKLSTHSRIPKNRE